MYETRHIIFMHAVLSACSLMYCWYFPTSECSAPVFGGSSWRVKDSLNDMYARKEMSNHEMDLAGKSVGKHL